MKTKIEITPAMRAWNVAVEEFDRATRYQFDRKDGLDIVLIASLWPSCSAHLTMRLAALRPAVNETKKELAEYAVAMRRAAVRWSDIARARGVSVRTVRRAVREHFRHEIGACYTPR